VTTCIVTIIARAAVKAQAWARIIFMCGGWLNLKKCYWYAISWRFKPTGEAVMETISDNPNLKISITQKGQPPKDIERVEITEGRDEEYDHRVNEGKKLRQRMQKAPLNKESTVIGNRPPKDGKHSPNHLL
jgi:hypothetical protein